MYVICALSLIILDTTADLTQTSGLIEAFNKTWFLTSLDKHYEQPLLMDRRFACLLHLVFAIGLELATPPLGSPEAAAIDNLSHSVENLAEQFFRSATHFADPLNGFEDGGIMSIQALLLMAVYKVSVSNRNAAWRHLGRFLPPKALLLLESSIDS